MKVLIVCTTKFKNSGITQVILNNYISMDKSDMHFDFAFINEPTNAQKNLFNENGSNFYVLPNRHKNLVKYIKKLSEILKIGSYDVIHIHGNSRTMALELKLAKKHGVRLRIPHGHSTFTKYPNLHKFLKPLFIRNYNYPLACGKAAGSFLYGEDNFNILENAIDINKFKYNSQKRHYLRRKLKWEDNFIIGNVASFTKPKNHIFLIKCFNYMFKKNSDLRLVLLGEGELFQEVLDLVDSLNLTKVVYFAGNVDNVQDYYSAFDVLFMPSLFEGLPLTLIEAQSSDLECLVSDTITKEVKLTDLISYFNLSESYSNIYNKLEEIKKSKYCREQLKGHEKISKSNYNIVNGSKKLKEIYLSSN
ncbi:glycosyltransferase [Aerococcus kribbianus]|uniref:Glycosyltransferase n=1 Tax=Aerococcus kribbianus TaxID=2999064 RepID=A0A9X3FP75_9LACT|nr:MULTISPECIES: glycosyltransferase [unclassified Aerococcus]MCZ0717178.1 glycosyltransferase [Aerococcus sp. YH-aer221]MCZ0725466.1 glycosyltransferase [Aerococcus sp. YH-aer222]